MARGDSVINVTIKGDAKDLSKALDSADSKVKGFGTSFGTIAKAAGGALVAGAAIGAGFEFLQGALDKSDKFGDSIDRIAGTLGQVDAQKIRDIAFSMTDIGLSADEVGTLAANFADLATAAGVSAPLISAATPNILRIAQAIAATTGKTVDEVVTDIGKAAAGAQKPVSDLGVVVDRTLSPDQTLTSILDQLNAKFPDVSAATSDLAGNQDQLSAKWDNFMIKVGDGLQGPLTGVLEFFNHVIDDIPRTVKGFEDLGATIEGFARTALAPLGNVRDALGGIGDILNNLNKGLGAVGNAAGLGPRDRQTADSFRRTQIANGLSGTLGRP